MEHQSKRKTRLRNTCTQTQSKHPIYAVLDDMGAYSSRSPIGWITIFLIVVFIVLITPGTLSSIQPVSAARPLGEEYLRSSKKIKGLLLENLLPRGATPGPSECTNVPGNGGGGRCPLGEMNFAGHVPVAVHGDSVTRGGSSSDSESTLLQRA
ncbi:hypothetical protein H6P81_015506 [Aristolochia fimbriata]|uniref:Uncharacterized protein n=1 Tax=Aristolochia fimbriata TaxID=158543 RepID=A0AAV7E8N4_ARIFI|nr:hypothetical protein H6P81_015506 [Aristolochia fimbriata]